MEPTPRERNEKVTYYATQRLAEAGRTIAALADAMPRARARLDRTREKHPDQSYDAYCELLKSRDKLVDLLNDARLAFAETGAQPLSELSGVLGIQLSGLDVMIPDYSGIEAVLKSLAAEMAPEKAVNAAVMGRMMNEARMGFYPTDPENVRHIARGIQFPEDTKVNLLDPCCGEGAALYTLAAGGNCATYGIELDIGRAEKAQDRLDRVGFGSFFGSQLSHEAFQLLFLNPPYISVVGENGRSRDEKRFLVSSLPYLMQGGILVYIIPFYRLTLDICRLLADYFGDLSLYRFTDEEFKEHRQVAIFGVRRQKVDSPEIARVLERGTYAPEALPCLCDLPEGRYRLPEVEKEVTVFKGAVFNQLELARQLQASRSVEQLLEKSGQSATHQRPLLPLSVSQIGLVGGSGLINGLVDCDMPHVVKGRIIKHKTTSRELFTDDRGRITGDELKETFSNKMVFHMVTKYGFKALT